MKLNFWQWLAIVLLVVGLAWWYLDYRHHNDGMSAPPPPGNAATIPTTMP
jgi:hypothetical protein